MRPSCRPLSCFTDLAVVLVALGLVNFFVIGRGLGIELTVLPFFAAMSS